MLRCAQCGHLEGGDARCCGNCGNQFSVEALTRIPANRAGGPGRFAAMLRRIGRIGRGARRIPSRAGALRTNVSPGETVAAK